MAMAAEVLTPGVAGARKGGIGVATAAAPLRGDVASGLGVHQGAPGQGIGEGHHRFERIDLDHHLLGGILGERPTARDHQSDRLADIAHPVERDDRLQEVEQFRQCAPTQRYRLGKRREVARLQNRDHAVRGQCRTRVQPDNSAGRECAAHDHGVMQIGAFEVVDIPAAPGQQPGILPPQQRLTNQRCGRHAQALPARRVAGNAHFALAVAP